MPLNLPDLGSCFRCFGSREGDSSSAEQSPIGLEDRHPSVPQSGQERDFLAEFLAEGEALPTPSISSEHSPAPAGRAASEHDDRGLDQRVYTAYQKSRLAHGTTEESKENIRAFGFTKERKVDGATARLTNDPSGSGGKDYSRLAADARDGHYLSPDPMLAGTYARYLGTDNPAIVRTIGVREDPGVSQDRFGVMGLSELHQRSAADIPADAVMASKRSEPSAAEGARFQPALRSEGVFDRTDEEAGRLLRDAQSDSEDDFR